MSSIWARLFESGKVPDEDEKAVLSCLSSAWFSRFLNIVRLGVFAIFFIKYLRYLIEKNLYFDAGWSHMYFKNKLYCWAGTVGLQLTLGSHTVSALKCSTKKVQLWGLAEISSSKYSQYNWRNKRTKKISQQSTLGHALPSSRSLSKMYCPLAPLHTLSQQVT